jgi:hypothetical protein
MTWKPLGDCTRCGARLFTNGLTVEDDWSGIHCISWHPRDWVPIKHQPPEEKKKTVAQQTYTFQAKMVATFTVTAETWEQATQQVRAWEGRFLHLGHDLPAEDTDYCNAANIAVLQYEGGAGLTMINGETVHL